MITQCKPLSTNTDNDENDDSSDNQDDPPVYSSCDCPQLDISESRVINVSTVDELMAAVDTANNGGDTAIVLASGTYQLSGALMITANQVAFYGHSGNRDDVIIRGQGMWGDVGYVFWVQGSYFKAAHMTIGWVCYHAVQIHGQENADNPIIYDVRIVNTGEQMVKMTYAQGNAAGSDNGQVRCCLFEYSDGIGPQYYIGGLDGHQCSNWQVINNEFRYIKSPDEDLAEFAIHFWTNSKNNQVMNNRIVDCDRGIGFGMGDRGHQGGIIANNMIYTTRDVGISLETASNISVYNNSLYTENYNNSIEYRFSGSHSNRIINNLTNALIQSRDGGQATLQTNYQNAQAGLFINISIGDLHLKTSAGGVVNAGTTLADLTFDFDCTNRPLGSAYDIGADEHQ
jgi:hypothetical protein